MPSGIMVLDYNKHGKHLVVDGVMYLVYKNTYLNETYTNPGYGAKQVENMTRLYADMASTMPVSTSHGDPHVMVPFAMEDEGRLGPMLIHSFLILRVRKSGLGSTTSH